MSNRATPARLVLAADRRRTAPLAADQPLTIGRASGNRLCLASAAGVSDHHAVVRFSAGHGWVVCDWQSRDGTWLEGQQVRQCRPLRDGDEIRLGLAGPVLIFEMLSAAPEPAAAPATAPAPARASASASAPVSAPTGSGSSITVEGETLAVADLRSASVRTDPRHPQIFSWWLLLCLGGLLLLPFPLLFWPLQLLALAGWILLGSRKDHTLVLELRDGRAVRHRFANRRTALAHRNGIRNAIAAGAPRR